MTGSAPALGVAFVPTLPPERLPELALTAEAAGLDELWVWEDCFKHSGIASAAVALALTARLRVGIGLLPVPLRNVALTAMELATLARAFPGRLRPGIGHGVQEWMGQAGARVGSPLTLLREHAVVLRALLAGQQVTWDGRHVRLHEVALTWPPDPPPPLLVGGSGPRSRALAAELGDGLLLTNALSLDEVAAAGRALHDQAGPGAALVATQIVATGSGAADRLARELPLWGAEPGRPVGTAGDADAVAAAVRRLAEVGATSVCVQPTADEPDLAGFVRFLGEEVRPRLGAPAPGARA